MAENSKIEWTHHTFNPWIGCTKVGPGCDHCYAEALATTRLGVTWGNEGERRRTAPSTWKQPRRWNNRAAKLGVRERVFCASLADVFDNRANAAVRAELFQLIRETPQLDWLLVTKRIGNAAAMIEAAGGMPDNVWLGVTIVNQEEADRDIPKLLATPASVRFLSMEPLLGPVDLTGVKAPRYADEPEDEIDTDWRFDALETGDYYWFDCGNGYTDGGDGPYREHRIDWVIVGGESGAGARPMHPDWVRRLRDQCAAADVPFLFKQWGEWAPVSEVDVESLDLYRERRHGPRRCKVNQLVMQASGRVFPMSDWSHIFGEDRAAGDFAYAAGARAMQFLAIGKQRAGRLLDGVEHNGFPA